MQPIRIRPEYTLLITYDIRSGVQELCYRYMVGEFVPRLQEMHLYMYNAWHVAYGDFPEWQVEFITERRAYITRLLDAPDWDRLERRLKSYCENYSRRVVPYRGSFHM